MIAQRQRGCWRTAKDGDPVGLALYLRHYSARKRSPKARLPLFVGPGEKLVLLSHKGDAVLAWRRMLYTQDGQSGVCCAVFRNEGTHRSSSLIREAMRLAWRRWPGERLYTYVDPARIRSAHPGCCFKRAGWKTCGKSRRGLIVLEMKPGFEVRQPGFLAMSSRK